MISIEQVQAARALLSWTQKDLAKASKISLNTINNIERRVLVPRVSTINKIQRTIEDAGIEFTEGNGVKVSVEKVSTKMLEGKDSIFSLWQDILSDLSDGDERLLNGIDENKFMDLEETRFDKIMSTYVQRGLKGKILSLEGDTNFPDFSSEYRWVGEDNFSTIPHIIYHNKVALVLWDPILRILIIENSKIAESYRRSFNILWKKAKIPPKI